jgi:hypothetical protein
MTESIKKKPTILLSPATQAVMNAYYCGAPLTGRDRVAAALRAAADQVLPEHIESFGVRHRFLAIAAELEGQ